MAIKQMEDIQAWQLARELTNMVYRFTRQKCFIKDHALTSQIRKAAGSSMHNIAEGFDSGSDKEFIRFLRYTRRSCTEVQSQLYIAMDQKYISIVEFHKCYQLASRTRAAVQGFVFYLQRTSS